MKEGTVRLGPRDQQIVELLLQGCDNTEIAKQLKMAPRTVKARFNRLFLKFGITQGIKRVKLATMLYRRQLCLEPSAMGHESPANAKAESSNLSPKVSKIEKSQTLSAQPNTSLRTISGSSTTNSVYGTESNLPYGTRLAATSKVPAPESPELWEHSILQLRAQMLNPIRVKS
jgi:Bacterial regulatory proteins, luxR family